MSKDYKSTELLEAVKRALFHVKNGSIACLLNACYSRIANLEAMPDIFTLMAALAKLSPVGATVRISNDIDPDRLRVRWIFRERLRPGITGYECTMLREEITRMGLDNWIEKMGGVIPVAIREKIEGPGPTEPEEPPCAT